MAFFNERAGSLLLPDALSRRINKLPKWARDYIHNVETFVGAPEVEELMYLRDERRQLTKLIKELKTDNRRLQKKLKQRHAKK